MAIELYNAKYFRASRKFQTNDRRLNSLVNLVLSQNIKSVLDVGCGLGNLVYRLKEKGISVKGVDFAPALIEFWGNNPDLSIAEAAKLPFSDKEFNLVFSSDFFEHLSEEEIDKVFQEMSRVGEKIIAVVATEAKLTKNQTRYHQTNKPLAWWKEKLKGAEVYQSVYED